MAVPDFQTLMLPVLATAANESEIASPELRRRVALSLSLSPGEVGERLPSGRQTILQNRVAFALVHLQRAALMEKMGNERYRITPQGRHVLQLEPARIDINYLKTLPEYNRQTSSKPDQPAINYNNDIVSASANHEFTPSEIIERAALLHAQALEQELIARVRQISPEAFERLILDLLVAMNYGGGRAELAHQTQLTNDGGIDGLIKEDPLGLDLVAMQAKRYTPPNTVGRTDLQSFVGGLDGRKIAKGIFVTTSTFTSGAQDYAQSIQKRLILIDGDELAQLMIRYGVGVRVTQTFELKDIDENVFEEG